MSGQTNCPCAVQQPTIFVFNSVQTQVAANAVYEYKKAYDAAQAAAGKIRSTSLRLIESVSSI
jgi:hypothetical protein